MDNYPVPSGYQPPSYSPPPPPPPPRRGIPFWGWVLLGCGIPFIAAAVLIIMFSLRMARVMKGEESFMSSMVPKAKVHIGQPLAWRELLSGSEMNHANLGWGNFDSDPADELFVHLMPGLGDFNLLKEMQNPPTTHYSFETHIIELDGTEKVSGTNDWMQFFNTQRWDYDHDGRDEIVSLNTGNGGSAVYDTQGKVLKTLPGEPGYWGEWVKDMDGDGYGDLLLQDSQSQELRAYGKDGQQIMLWKLGPSDYNPVAADLDGDGKAELVLAVIEHGSSSAELTLKRSGKPDEKLTAAWDGYSWPVLGRDVDGDGREELFASNRGFFNPASGRFTAFKWPAGYEPEDPSREVLPFDLDGDGKPEFATGGNNFSMDSALFIFAADGACRYYEELGAPVEQKCVLRDGQGQEHLVLQTDVKLLIYP